MGFLLPTSATIMLAVYIVISEGSDPVWLQHLGRESSMHFTNEWIAKIDGGDETAVEVAANLGYKFLGQVRGFPGVYRMLKEDFPQVRKRGEPRLTQTLVKEDRVQWAEQQFAKEREKRDFLPLSPPSAACDPWCAYDETLENKFPKTDSRHLFNDELWNQQWYLQDTRTRLEVPKMDLHVLDVYKKGISGKGVRVCVLDDGIEMTHPDLKDNYDPEISLDVNDEDYNPLPRYDSANTNSHGTRCAGEIAMAANNKICGVGVAFNARIGGVRMLDGIVSDLTEGLALGWAHGLVDIYSASWGPKDDGKTVEGPGRLALAAILNGVSKGRGGKGIIFVWASGNGGHKGDDCNCDGYAASPYTLSISSASETGQFPWYGESCPSTLAATYSSGENKDQMIATTDLHGKCTTKHTGTSAAAPLAAGIIALALEANPLLTWRDVQHLVVWTSQPLPLANNPGWKINGAGYLVNPNCGFGLMKAESLVSAAESWITVPQQRLCVVKTKISKNVTLSPASPVVLTFHTSGCNRKLKKLLGNTFMENGAEVNYLEHVEVEASIIYSVRGALQIYLTSPQDTTVQLLKVRPADKSSHGFQRWRFMSVLTWGENPKGTWKLHIRDATGSGKNHGLVGHSTVLLLRGTRYMPAYLKSGPRKYDKDYSKVFKKTAIDPGRYFEKLFLAGKLGDSRKLIENKFYEPNIPKDFLDQFKSQLNQGSYGNSNMVFDEI